MPVITLPKCDTAMPSDPMSDIQSPSELLTANSSEKSEPVWTVQSWAAFSKIVTKY